MSDVQKLMNERGYMFLTPFTKKSEIHYQCKCGKEKKQTFYDMKTKKCRYCKSTSERQNQRAYKNMIKFLDSISMTNTTSVEDFYENNCIKFKCPNLHINTLNKQSYNNKRNSYIKHPEEFCSMCKKNVAHKIKKEEREQHIHTLLDNFGNKLLRLEDDLKTMMVQCNCGNETSTNYGTICREDYKGRCIKCNNEPYKKDIRVVKQEVEQIGLELFTTEYINNKTLVMGCSKCHFKYAPSSISNIKKAINKHYHCSNCGDGVGGKFVKLVNTDLCYRCYCYENPDEPIPFRFKMKEHFFREAFEKFMSSLDIGIDFITPEFDKQISNGCSRRRPDILIDCYTHIIVLELDENQHSGYTCENKRLCEIFRDLGNRPIVFLRLNPDSYKNEDGKYISSCFYYSKGGAIKIRQKEWKTRCNVMFTNMVRYMSSVPTREMTVKSFFFSK